MKRAFAMLCFAVTVQGADVIPARYLFDARPGITLGVRGGIPSNRTEYTNLLTAGADPTGGTSAHTLLSSLINSCPSNQYIRIPSNTIFRLSSALSVSGGKKGWSIVGDNRTAELVIEAGLFNIDNHSFQPPIRITSHLAAGTTNFTVESAVSTDYIGARFRVSSKNEGRTNAVVMSSGFFDRLLNQYPDIVAITDGTNITCWPPIAKETALDLDPWFHVEAANLNEYFGLENLTITKSNRITSATGDTTTPINIYGGRNWWIRNCTIINREAGVSVNLIYNSWFEIRDSDFFMAAAGSGTSTIILYGENSAWLIENNSSEGASPFVQANACSAAATSYNYVTNAVSDDTNVGNPFDMHQPHSSFLLWEGNEGSMWQADQYHGSASDQVLYRNRFRGHDPVKHGLRRAIHGGRWLDNLAVVACDLGTTATNFWITTTNQFWTSTSVQGLLLNTAGWPYPGNSSYGYNVSSGHHRAIITGRDVHRLFPGTNFQVGVVTQATAFTNFIHGPFENGLYTSWPSVANGDKIVFGNATDDYFWHLNTNSLLLASSHTSSGITLNRAVWVSNAAKVYLVGPESHPALDLVQTNTHFYEALWLSTNNAVTWSGATNLSGLPKSYLYGDTAPAWFTNEHGTMHWPPFGIATEGDTAKTNKLPAEIRKFSLVMNTHDGEQDIPPGPGAPDAAPGFGGTAKGITIGGATIR